MKKILVPTDFSKLADQALEFAVHLAKPMNAEVSIIHFEDVPLGDMQLHLTGEAQHEAFPEDSLFSAQLFRANKEKLQAYTNMYSQSGLVISGQQLGGGFLKGIQHYVKNNEVELVVIGTTGEESVQEFFSGNHTEQLIEHLTIPVLSVQGPVDQNIKDIVIGLDFLEEKYSLPAFNKIKGLLKGLDARLHIVNIVTSDPPETLISDLNKLAKIVGLENYIVDVISAKNAVKGLMDFVEEVDAGMVITISEARTGVYRFFQHSFSTKLTKVSKVPVLTVNKKRL